MKFEVSKAFQFRANRGNGTDRRRDRRTDGHVDVVQCYMRPPSWSGPHINTRVCFLSLVIQFSHALL